MEGLTKTFANCKNTESLAGKHDGQFSYFPNCSSWVLSFFICWGNFQKISPKMKARVCTSLEIGREPHGRWPTGRPGVWRALCGESAPALWSPTFFPGRLVSSQGLLPVSGRWTGPPARGPVPLFGEQPAQPVCVRACVCVCVCVCKFFFLTAESSACNSV